MSFTIHCERCLDELDVPGALVFSPPTVATSPDTQHGLTKKYHICTECWRLMLRWICGAPEGGSF